MLWRLARRYGLFRPTKDQLVAGNKRIAAAANEEIERRITETPAEVSDRDLIVASGVAQDKIAKAEHWDRTLDDSDYAGSLRELAKQLSDLPRAQGRTPPRADRRDAGVLSAAPCTSEMPDGGGFRRNHAGLRGLLRRRFALGRGALR